MKQLKPKQTKLSTGLQLLPFFLLSYGIAGNLSNDLFLPSMPHLTTVFHCNDALIQLALSLWFVGIAIPQLFFGAYADTHGRKKLLLWGGILFIITTAVCAMASNLWVFLPARLLQGIAVASFMVTSIASIRDIYQEKQGIQLISHIRSISTLSPLLGPLLGGYILVMYGWQANFWILVILATMALIGLWKIMPESYAENHDSSFGLKQHFQNYQCLLKDGVFIRASLIYGFIFAGITAYMTGAPFVIIDHFHVSAEYYGLTQLVVFAAFLVSAPLTTVGEEKMGRNWLIALGVIIIAIAGSILITLTKQFPDNIYAFIFPMIMFGFGFGFASGPLNSITLSNTNQYSGSAAGLLGFITTSCGALGSLLVTVLYTGSVNSLANVIGGLAIVTLVALIVDIKYSSTT